MEERIYPKDHSFSSWVNQYYAAGTVKWVRHVEAFPDTGADSCFVSANFAALLRLEPVSGTHKVVRLANNNVVQSPGMVKVPWIFAGERERHVLDCWILPGCVHKLVLGNAFLRATQTLTTFARRIKSRLTQIPKRLRLARLGEDKQRLWGTLDGHPTAALPDTGSDGMFISSEYAKKRGLDIEHDPANWLEVEFADGTTAWTSGVVRDAEWFSGGRTLRCDFHVLDHLCADVVLSKDYLFKFDVFSTHEEFLFDVDSDGDLAQLCNIRLIGRYSEGLEALEGNIWRTVSSIPARISTTRTFTNRGSDVS
jgi:hypothetical protein